MQEGGLEPLTLLTTSEDVEILREVVAALCNLSLSDENKYEISKCGAIAPLVIHAQSEDMEVSRQSCGAIANLAEMNENRIKIAVNFSTKRCI